MSWQEKLDEMKQRKEARDFFNQNNDAKATSMDYAKGFFIGVGAAMIGGIVLTLISSVIGMSFIYLYILAGYIVGQTVKRILNKGTMALGVIVAIAYVIGTISGSILFSIFDSGFTFSFELFMFLLRMSFISFRSFVVFAIGAVMAFASAKD